MVNIHCDDKEWIRRRQIRLIQVRKQSNDIAKQLRERVINEERQRRLEEENELERKLHIWKVKRLSNLEEMYRKAISDFGKGHKMAIKESNPVTEIKEKQKKYLCKAKERGETAMLLQLKEKREAAEKKQIPIQRKLITRKIEDLRSSLVCSIPAKEPSVIVRDIYAGKPFDPKKFENTYEFEEPTERDLKQEERKQLEPVKSTSETCVPTANINQNKRKTQKNIGNKIKGKSGIISDENKGKISNLVSSKCDNIWVNLGAVETLSKEEGETNEEEISRIKIKHSECERERNREKNLKEKEKIVESDKEKGKKKFTPEKQKPSVECHGYSLRENCKLKDTVYLVQRMNNISEPNAVELALMEEEKLLLEKKEEEIRKTAAEERGNKAIEKEKIIKNYNELLVKLEKLSTKEKLIKSYCHIPPVHLFFSDERRKEKSARKQRIMDSKFERIYYDVMGGKPDIHLNTQLNLSPLTEEVKAENGCESVITKLDFSKLDSNLKTNSPASSCGSISQRKAESNRIRSPFEKVSIKKTPSSFHFKRTKIIKGDDKALTEIDKILKKSRELRQDSQLKANIPSDETKSDPDCSEKELKTNPETENVSCESTANGSIELQLCKSDASSPCDGKRISDINDLKNSPKRNLSIPEKAVLEDLAMGDVPRKSLGIRTNITAWPLREIKRTQPEKGCSVRSSSTSYRSLPPVHPKRINPLRKILNYLKEKKGRCTVADELIVELEKLLGSSDDDAGQINLNLNDYDCNDLENNNALNYYITKLLNMSREKIADLSVSSENDTSFPKLPIFCNNQNDQEELCAENEYVPETSHSGRISKLDRVKELEEIIKNWKIILEQNLNSFPTLDEFSQSEEYENNPKCASREEQNGVNYDEISKKCSDRMAILSRVIADCIDKGYIERTSGEYGELLQKRDRDKQKPKTGCQSDSSRPKNINPEGSFCSKRENKECPVSKSPRKILDYCDDNTCPFLQHLYDGNRANLQQADDHKSADDSLGSYPNVMEELLKKKIISSPFRWSQGNVLSDYSPKGSHHSRKSKADSIHNEINQINQVNKPPEKNEQECPKTKVNNCLYEPYKCKDSCKGSCSAAAAKNIEQGGTHHTNKSPVPENAPVCEERFQTKVIKRPRRRELPISYRDPEFGIFSPIQRDPKQKCKPKQMNDSSELCLEHPQEIFKKKTFASQYIWDKEAGGYIVNTNKAAPAAHRPFWEPGEENPNSPRIKFHSVKKCAQGSPKRPKSSPVRGDGREDGPGSAANPHKVENESCIPYVNLMNLTGSKADVARGSFKKEIQSNPRGHCGSSVYQHPATKSDMSVTDADVMAEWNRRNLAYKQFHRGSYDSCAGSCAVHCYNSWNLRRTSSCSVKEDTGRVENRQRAANSSPDMRACGVPFRASNSSPIRCQYEEECGEDESEEEEDCTKDFYFKWPQDLFRDFNERNRL